MTATCSRRRLRRQVGQEIAGRVVCPVEVLDHEQHGAFGAESPQQAEDELEQPGLVGPAGRTRRPGAGRGTTRRATARREIGQEAGQLHPRRAKGGIENVRLEVASEIAERLGEGRVRETAVRDGQAVSGQHARAAGLHRSKELGDEPGSCRSPRRR